MLSADSASSLTTGKLRPAPAAGPIRFSSTALSLALLTGLAALLLQLADALVTVSFDASTGVALLAQIAALFLVRSMYRSDSQYLFSTGFWLSITVFFYVVLKAVDLWYKDDLTPVLVEVLWLTTLFLLFYCFGYLWTEQRRAKSGLERPSRYEVVIPKGGEWTLLAVYIGFKLIGIGMLARVGGNALEVAAATANAGASYLYKIPAAANAIFMALLYNAFRYKRGWTVTLIALTFYLVDALVSTSRLSIVLLVLLTAYLYHRYRCPLSLFRISFIGLPLILVVVLFGYARNLEVGSVDAYVQAAQVLREEPTLVSDLFMNRLDMLPEMGEALTLYRTGSLPSLQGGSYLYAFLHAVPRNIWEAKPLLTAALVTSQTHPGPFADGVNIFPSIIVEGILNLSLAGVVLNGLLVGMLSRLYERLLDSSHLLKVTWALTLLTFPMALFNEGIHSNYFASVLYGTAVMFVLYRLLLIFGALKRQTPLA